MCRTSSKRASSRQTFDVRIHNEGLHLVIATESLAGVDWEDAVVLALDEEGAAAATAEGIFVPLALAQDNALTIRVVLGDLEGHENRWAAHTCGRLRVDCGRLVLGNGPHAIQRDLLPDPATRAFSIPVGDYQLDSFAYVPAAAWMTGQLDLGHAVAADTRDGRRVDLLLRLSPWTGESRVHALSTELSGQPALVWTVRDDDSEIGALGARRMRLGRQFKPRARRAPAKTKADVRPQRSGLSELARSLVERRTNVTPRQLAGRLFECLRLGDLGGIEALLDQGADPLETAGFDMSPLESAIVSHPAALAVFKAHFETRGVPVSLELSLLTAVRRGDIDRVKAAISRGPRAAEMNDALASSLLGDHRNTLVGLLLDAGADPSGAPLRTAVRWGNQDLVLRFLDAGARPDPGTLEVAAASHSRLGVLNLLLEAGGQPTEAALSAAAEAGNELAFEMLASGLEAGLVGKYRPRLHESEEPPLSLYEAASSGYPAAVEHVLARGAAIDAPLDHYNGTALVFAVKSGHAEMVQMLLDKGANPNVPLANPALHWAADVGRADLVRMLLDAGADPRLRDQCDELAVEQTRDRDVIALLGARDER